MIGMILSLTGLIVILTMIEHSQLAINRVMNSAMSMSFVWLYKAITIGDVFLLFSGVGVITWVFYFLCCPETIGRALEEKMEEVFLKLKDKKLRNNKGGV
ncbi:putative polyol transporter 6 isoform X2 [Canna indica]|uniref:Polyol transporter 6 isoform X2 n=1 Tax=Canna indica TaxID=4628 RepID=A0AAQ3L4W5_9LILI|nr:putative polyol transporter 6 isoform X2 [Canna indica]